MNLRECERTDDNYSCVQARFARERNFHDVTSYAPSIPLRSPLKKEETARRRMFRVGV